MAIPTITGYTGVIPDRRTQSAEDFTSAAVTWTDYQATTLVPSTNAAIDGINAAQDEILDSVNNAEESSFIAQAAANYQGAWFSGAQVVKGESWSHNGLMWAANVTGADEPQENAQWFLLNSEPELSAIKVMLEQWGYRYAGLFDDGFTYELFNDVGIDADGNSWIYVGTGAPNKVVAAGTVPSVGAGYKQVTFNALQALAGLDEPSELDDVFSRGFGSVDELKAFDVRENTLVKTRRYYEDIAGGAAEYVISSTAPSEVGKINHLLSNGLYAVFIPQEDSKIKARQAGARFDNFTDDIDSFKAIRDSGYKKVVLGIGVTLWSDRLVYTNTNNIEFIGAGNTKFVEAGGYQPFITQITPTFDSVEPLLDIYGGVNNSVKSIAFVAGQGVPSSYSGAALRNRRGSQAVNVGVRCSGFKLGQRMDGHIYGEQRGCVSEGGSDGFAYEGISGESQTNICTSYHCKARFVHTGFAVNSTTAITLHCPAGEVISGQYGSDRGTDSCFILDNNNKNLTVSGTAYLEGSDRFISAPQTNPSISTVIENFYYNNHENYVVNGLLQDFGVIGANTTIHSGYIKNTQSYSGSGAITGRVGRIRAKDNCNIDGVVGGFLEIDASTDPTSVYLGNNEFGIERFKGVFYLSGADIAKLYRSNRRTFHRGNFSITTNASGWVNVDTGLGDNKVGSLIINAYITQNTVGDTISSFQDGTGIVRLYIRDSSGALVTSGSRSINLTVEVVENF